MHRLPHADLVGRRPTTRDGVLDRTHVTYALVTAFLGLLGAGNYYGLDLMVGESAPPWVRRWLLSGTPGAGRGN